MLDVNKMSQAWLLPKPGSSKVFQLVDRKIAAPKDDEVRVQVHFSGLNFADILMRQGLYPDAPPYPFVPGYEVSGVVESLGRNVEGPKLGDRIYAGTAFGGHSSMLNLPSWQVLQVPEGMQLDEAAGIPVSAMTAYNILFELGRVRSGDRILIDCASGALGQMIQTMLKDYRVELWGLTSSKEKKKWLLEKGVKAMTHEEFMASGMSDFQLILNSLGGRHVKLHYQRLAPLGRLICIGASDAVSPGQRNLFKAIKTLLSFRRFKVPDLMNDNKGVMGLNVLRLLERAEILKEQLNQFESMNLTSVTDRIFSYQHLAKAHAYLEERHSRGKVLLDWRY